MTRVPLPPKLDLVENIWQYMRDNWLSNRIFANYEDILDYCCFNWNKLIERPWLITSERGNEPIGTTLWTWCQEILLDACGPRSPAWFKSVIRRASSRRKIVVDVMNTTRRN